MSEEMKIRAHEADTPKSKHHHKIREHKLHGHINLKQCDGFFVRLLAYLANFVMIVVACFAVSDSYGNDSFFAMLLFVPPVLSILALAKQGDREERNLKKRIRKAHLRKELKALDEYDAQ